LIRVLTNFNRIAPADMSYRSQANLLPRLIIFRSRFAIIKLIDLLNILNPEDAETSLPRGPRDGAYACPVRDAPIIHPGEAKESERSFCLSNADRSGMPSALLALASPLDS
jgi:hypothetical protein